MAQERDRQIWPQKEHTMLVQQHQPRRWALHGRRTLIFQSLWRMFCCRQLGLSIFFLDKYVSLYLSCLYMGENCNSGWTVSELKCLQGLIKFVHENLWKFSVLRSMSRHYEQKTGEKVKNRWREWTSEEQNRLTWKSWAKASSSLIITLGWRSICVASLQGHSKSLRLPVTFLPVPGRIVIPACLSS